ncbi:MAG: hypothetical protein IT434_07770, partial [Phycisphaerales bacterium]|nr:hypothetical protein [Phycisphaerales bacterium]
TRTHNAANELLTRDTDSNSSVNYTLTHDAVGNLTDDGKDYSHVSDAFGRLRTVKNRGNSAVVAEYTYNGLNMRIGWHSDADADADVDANDPWYSFAMDDRWRIVATFRGSDTSPKELFAYHNAGANGRGSSSYIDSVILRNRDANTSWTSSADGTLEERVYYVQNWRADVSAVLSDAGVVKEWVKYTSYGIPIRIDPADYNRDGFVNATDFDDYGDDFDNARAEADVNFDGSVNGDDYDLFAEWFDAPSTAGRFTLSASSVANRFGYAGYQHDPTFVGASRAIYHVRHRVYDAGLGRWTKRNPLGYVEGDSLYSYCYQYPLRWVDPSGLPPWCPRPDYDCAVGSGNGGIDCQALAETYVSSTLHLSSTHRCWQQTVDAYVKECEATTPPSPRRGERIAVYTLQFCIYQTHDSCSFSPDGPFGLDFSLCCHLHDRCYDQCGMPKLACDMMMCECLENMCVTKWAGIMKGLCLLTATSYCAAVSSDLTLPGYTWAQLKACRKRNPPIPAPW